MRHFLAVTIAILAVLPLLAQKHTPAQASVCAPELSGYVMVGQGHYLRGAVVDLLVGADQKVLVTRRTDAHGLFRLPGGRARKGSEWLVRISSHGQNTILATLKIDPQCALPAIRLNGPGGDRP